MHHTMRDILQSAYRTAQQCFGSVIVTESPLLEEQTYWDVNKLQISGLAETTPSLQFVEPPAHLATVPVVDKPAFAADSQLCFWLDGAQRTRLLFIAGTIPVCYTVNAVAVVRRRFPGGRLESWLISPQVRSAILLPRTPATRPLWDAFEQHGMPVEDTLTAEVLHRQPQDMDTLTASFELGRYLAYNRARLLRQDLERQVIAVWLQSHAEDWLVIDGNLRHLGAEIVGRSLVGIIKQQQQDYFSGSSQALLLGLPAFSRSNTFRFSDAAEHGAHIKSSFFLRWRPRQPREDIGYGLLRIETSFELDTAQADTLGRWIIAEGRPYQSGRNGNHLYPVAKAEQFAKRLVQDQWRALPRRWL